MILPAILKRRAVREYASDDVTDDQVMELLLAARMAPTGHGKRAVEFIVVRKSEMKQFLKGILSQEFLTQAPVLIVPVVPTDVSATPVQDLSIATQTIFLQAAEMGLGTVWKNVGAEQLSAVRQALGVPDSYLLVSIIPVGRPAKSVSPHTAAEKEGLCIHVDKW